MRFFVFILQRFQRNFFCAQKDDGALNSISRDTLKAISSLEDITDDQLWLLRCLRRGDLLQWVKENMKGKYFNLVELTSNSASLHLSVIVVDKRSRPLIMFSKN